MSQFDLQNGNVTDETLSEMFKEYVKSMEDKERHTAKACEEVDTFDQYCEMLFPNDIKQQNEMYDRMMNCAVEYEEGGFIAGAKWVLSMMHNASTT